jgi:hypothetical protein
VGDDDGDEVEEVTSMAAGLVSSPAPIAMAVCGGLLCSKMLEMHRFAR